MYAEQPPPSVLGSAPATSTGLGPGTRRAAASLGTATKRVVGTRRKGRSRRMPRVLIQAAGRGRTKATGGGSLRGARPSWSNAQDKSTADEKDGTYCKRARANTGCQKPGLELVAKPQPRGAALCWAFSGHVLARSSRW